MKIHRWKIRRGREFLKLTIYILNASIIYIYIYENVKYISLRFFKIELILFMIFNSLLSNY